MGEGGGLISYLVRQNPGNEAERDNLFLLLTGLVCPQNRRYIFAFAAGGQEPLSGIIPPGLQVSAKASAKSNPCVARDSRSTFTLRSSPLTRKRTKIAPVLQAIEHEHESVGTHPATPLRSRSQSPSVFQRLLFSFLALDDHLRSFLCFALRIPTAHDFFAPLARAHPERNRFPIQRKGYRLFTLKQTR